MVDAFITVNILFFNKIRKLLKQSGTLPTIVLDILEQMHQLTTAMLVALKEILRQRNVDLNVHNVAMMILKPVTLSKELVDILEIRKHVQWFMVVTKKFHHV